MLEAVVGPRLEVEILRFEVISDDGLQLVEKQTSATAEGGQRNRGYSSSMDYSGMTDRKWTPSSGQVRLSISEREVS
jgi:hypothetical protein